MGILHRLGLITIKEYNESLRRQVDEMNRQMVVELGKRDLLVEETLMEIAKWKFDPANLVGKEFGMTVVLEVPRALVRGLASSLPDIASFALTRTTHLLQVSVQKSINQLLGGQYNGEQTQGSYL